MDTLMKDIEKPKKLDRGDLRWKVPQGVSIGTIINFDIPSDKLRVSFGGWSNSKAGHGNVAWCEWLPANLTVIIGGEEGEQVYEAKTQEERLAVFFKVLPQVIGQYENGFADLIEGLITDATLKGRRDGIQFVQSRFKSLMEIRE